MTLRGNSSNYFTNATIDPPQGHHEDNDVVNDAINKIDLLQDEDVINGKQSYDRMT